MTDDRPAAAPRCQYTFAGTRNRCEQIPTHEVHIYGAWPGPEEYHLFTPAARPTPEPAPAPDLSQHRPTLWPNDPLDRYIHCKCGFRDHMDGWWAHLRVEVVEPMLRAAPADPLSVEALAEVERDLRDLHVAYRVIHGDAHGPMEYEDCGPCTSGRVALVALRASSRGAPTE